VKELAKRQKYSIEQQGKARQIKIFYYQKIQKGNQKI
jgi:hypothetical protein